MTFQPVVPISGYAGWRFLQRTLDTQKEAFVQSPSFERNTDYFRDKISSITTAEQLVNDRQLLEVALGAYGLDADIDSKAFIQRILEDGTIEDDALANRLSDKRYKQFSDAFGFGNLGARTNIPSFADKILDRYADRQFEEAVGNVDGNMRLALSLEAGLQDVASQSLSEDGQWFAVMGNPPLRSIFEQALGFPSSFGTIDIDQQREAFKERASSVFGTNKISDFDDPENQEKLIRLFMVRSQANAFGPTTAGTVALSLLQSAPNLYG